MVTVLTTLDYPRPPRRSLPLDGPLDTLDVTLDPSTPDQGLILFPGYVSTYMLSLVDANFGFWNTYSPVYALIMSLDSLYQVSHWDRLSVNNNFISHRF